MMSVSELANKRKITFVHSGLKKVIFDQLRTCGFMKHVHTRSFFWDLNDAVLFASKIINDNKLKTPSDSVTEKEEVSIDLNQKELPSSDYSPLIAGDEEEFKSKKTSCIIF